MKSVIEDTGYVLLSCERLKMLILFQGIIGIAGTPGEIGAPGIKVDIVYPIFITVVLLSGTTRSSRKRWCTG